MNTTGVSLILPSFLFGRPLKSSDQPEPHYQPKPKPKFHSQYRPEPNRISVDHYLKAINASWA